MVVQDRIFLDWYERGPPPDHTPLIVRHYLDYPHWQMQPELKAYYLMQAAYWCQQLMVLLLGLEKPRKDYYELVAHHFVTLWLVGYASRPS